MKKLLLALIFSATVLGACVVPGPRGEPVVVAPPLPSVVVLGQDPYYYQGGYYYWYDNDSWYWSRSRNRGDWHALPRDHYPREMRYRGRHWDRDRGWDRDDHDRDRDRDYDRGYDRDGGYEHH